MSRWTTRVGILLAGVALFSSTPVGSRAQEIISACGTAMGELEPWGQPAQTLPVDAGMTRRLEEMIRPLIVRLDGAEEQFRIAEQEGNVTILLDTLCERQAEVCSDVLALIGLLGKHEKEVGKWSLGGQSRAVGIRGEGFGQDILDRALVSGTRREQEQSQQAERWRWCASAWLPFECGIQFGEEEKRLLSEMGLSIQSHAQRAEWAWATLALCLRQVNVNSGSIPYPGGDLRGLLDRLVSTMVVEYHLGQTASPEYFQEQIEGLCGRKNILGLFQPARVNAWSFEDGEYLFRSLRPEAHNAVSAVLGQTPLAASLRGGCLFRQAKAETIARAYNYRLTQYRFLAAECARQCVVSGADVADIKRMYQPFLHVLARFPPCLSPYRADVVNENWLRFTDEHAVSTNVTTAGQDPLAKVDALLCLLQADAWRENGADWEWQPRAAGSRRHLDLFLAGGATNPAGKGNP